MSDQSPGTSVGPTGSDAESQPSPQASLPRRILSSHSPSFVQILAELKVSLLISTYQAGKLVVVQAHKDDLFITYHNFDRAMGIAVSSEQIAVGTTNQIWFMVHSRQVPRVSGPAFDACYLARGSQFTGEIHVHEIEWAGRDLWVVNTLFSCLCTVAGPHSFVPRWKPRFISTLAAEDRCHLNGMALAQGRPRFVTTLGATDSARGWKPNRVPGVACWTWPVGRSCFKGCACRILHGATMIGSGSSNRGGEDWRRSIPLPKCSRSRNCPATAAGWRFTVSTHLSDYQGSARPRTWKGCRYPVPETR